jgi:hypothetical protein
MSDVSALESCQSLVSLCGADRVIGGADVLRIIEDRR